MPPCAKPSKTMKNQCVIKTETKKAYVVENRTALTSAISTITFELPDGSIPAYRPGQFINVYFPESGTPEGKAYSMSSAPSEGVMSITVRAIGQFSNRLCALKECDTLVASLPYGYFNSESEDSHLVMLAGGIGVTPFRSMIVESLHTDPSRKMSLFYSSRTNADLIFKKKFDELQEKHAHFEAHYFVTREKPRHDPVEAGRMTAEGVLKQLRGYRRNQEFLICGSIPFVSDMWKGLRAGGVPEEAIYTEAFFSH